MVGFDVTCDGAPASALLATTIAGNRLLSMGPRADATEGPSSPVVYPASGLWTQVKKQGGRRAVTHHPGRLEDGEVYPAEDGIRYAAFLGQGAAECRLRR